MSGELGVSYSNNVGGMVWVVLTCVWNYFGQYVIVFHFTSHTLCHELWCLFF